MQIQMKWIWRLQTISVGKCKSTYPLILGWTAFAPLNRSGEQRTADVGLSHSFSLQTGRVCHWRVPVRDRSQNPNTVPGSLWLIGVKWLRSVQTKKNCPWISSEIFLEHMISRASRSEVWDRSQEQQELTALWVFFLNGKNYKCSIWMGFVF